jgi:cobalt/nickel transport system permease protein
VAAVVIGGGVSILASQYPDGMEWSILRIHGDEIEAAEKSLIARLTGLQHKISFMPDYEYKSATENNTQTSVAGIIGALLTVGLTVLIGAASQGEQEKRQQK